MSRTIEEIEAALCDALRECDQCFTSLCRMQEEYDEVRDLYDRLKEELAQSKKEAGR